MGVYWAVLSIIILIAIVLISRVNIRVTYLRESSDDEVIIIVSALFGLINIKNEFNLLELLVRGVPALKIRGEVEATAKGDLLKEFGDLVYAEKLMYYYRKYKAVSYKYREAINYAKKRVYIRKLKWFTVLGAGDAAVTGIAIGLLWNIKTIVSVLLNLKFKFLVLPDINIVPCFDGSKLSTNFDCILSIRIGHAIIAGMLCITAMKKGGDAIERASD